MLLNGLMRALFAYVMYELVLPFSRVLELFRSLMSSRESRSLGLTVFLPCLFPPILYRNIFSLDITDRSYNFHVFFYTFFLIFPSFYLCYCVPSPVSFICFLLGWPPPSALQGTELACLHKHVEPASSSLHSAAMTSFLALISFCFFFFF